MRPGLDLGFKGAVEHLCSAKHKRSTAPQIPKPAQAAAFQFDFLKKLNYREEIFLVLL
jgi:hypothetical protein